MDDYYSIKRSMFLSTPTSEGSVIFLGDSLTDWLSLSELLPGVRVLNRGIAGDTTTGVLQRLDEVIRHKPAKLFLLIGTNDIALGTSERKITGNIREIITRIQEGSPETVIYLQTLIPVNSRYMGCRHNMKIEAVNEGLRGIAEEKGCVLVDLHGLFEENGELPMSCSFDGLHLNGEGAVKWIEFVAPMVMPRSQKQD
ncbi:MAG: hypothetical protein IJP86_12175 [Synergistaceae bacterium]|nr:hypothetical protein [Synergistaceae bacterium]